MEENILVVGASRYQFKNDEGQLVEGSKVTYLTSIRNDDTNRMGYIPITANLPLSAWNDLGQVPGIYTLRSRQQPNARGKVELRPLDIRYREPATDVTDMLSSLDALELVKK